MILKFPVTPGKRERLLKSRDTIMTFEQDWLKIQVAYLMESPKDMEDDYSQMEEKLIEYCVEFLRKTVKSIAWQWDRVYECYEIEINIGGESYPFSTENKQEAISLYEKLVQWWKGDDFK